MVRPRNHDLPDSPQGRSLDWPGRSRPGAGGSLGGDAFGLPDGGGRAAERRQLMVELVSSGSTETLFRNLKQGFVSFGVTDFSIYTMVGSEAALAFSCGSTIPIDAHTRGSKGTVESLPWLHELLSGEAPFLLPEHDTPADGSFPALDAWGVSAVFRMKARNVPIGFVAIFGLVPIALFEPPRVDEVVAMVDVFSATFQKLRVADTMHRAYMRSTSRLREFQEAQHILMLSDRQAILDSVLQRALASLGAEKGGIWLREASAWRVAIEVGDAGAEGRQLAEPMVERAVANNKPGLVSSLSGEETWDFDVDTIHMASVVVFPLATRDEVIGCLVAYDTTVSQDSADTVGGTMLVGGIALESWTHRCRMLDQQRMEEQLALAAKAQQRLLPRDPGETVGLSVAYLSQYCSETGGDYVDVIPSPSAHACSFAVGDVSGHGLGAAMIMIDVRARLRAQLESGSPWSSAQVLSVLNSVLYRETAAEEFVTLFLGTVDTRIGSLRYASAGHEPPLVFRARESQWVELASTGAPLGLMRNLVFSNGCVRIEPGDILLFLTDGITEACDLSGAFFGTDKLRALVEENRNASAEEILEALARATIQHTAGGAFHDDVTFLVVKVDDVALCEADSLEVPSEAPTYSAQFASTRDDKEAQLAKIAKVVGDVYANRDVNDVVISLEEALTNAVRHGNGEDPGKLVRVDVWALPERVTICVRDEGRGFAIADVVVAHASESSLAKASGRGLVLMANLMDRVIYANGGRDVLFSRAM